MSSHKQKKYLDMQLDRIRKMIEESKPVWILDDFEPFFFIAEDKGFKRDIRMVRIKNRKDAKELLTILKNLSLKKKDLSKLII